VRGRLGPSAVTACALCALRPGPLGPIGGTALADNERPGPRTGAPSEEASIAAAADSVGDGVRFDVDADPDPDIGVACACG
jgi:hypothetical protein